MSVGPIGKPSERLNFPQFHLRTLFLVVALFGALFAIMGLIGPVASAGLLLLLALVGLHIAANALGTTLRDQSPTKSIPTFDTPRPAKRSIPTHRRPISRLYERTPLGWLIWPTSVAGSLAGGLLAGAVLVHATSVSVSGVMVGVVSSSILGAVFGFLAGGFLQMALGAWWQATSDSESIDELNACPRELSEL